MSDVLSGASVGATLARERLRGVTPLLVLALSACAVCPCWAAAWSSCSCASDACGLTSKVTFLIVPVNANGLRLA